MEDNRIQSMAAGVILDRGVRYKIGEGDITIRPLRFGTMLFIAGMVAESDLTAQKIEAGESDHFRLFAAFGDLMLRCVAAAELNSKEKLSSENLLEERVGFYRDNLNAYQVYELFVHVLNLSGIQSFKNTIRLLLSMKQKTLSHKDQGS